MFDFPREGGTEGVDISEGHGEVLGVELAGDGQAHVLAEEVLSPVDGAVLGAGRIRHVESRDAEHLARALAVGAGEQRRVDVDEAAALEELVYRRRRDAADAEHGGEQVRPRPEMLDGAQEFHAVALLLQRVIRRGGALHRYFRSLELKGLLGLGREHERALDYKSRAHVLPRDLVVIGQIPPLEHYLQALVAGAVVELDEAEILHVPYCPDPAADRYLTVSERGCVGINSRDPLPLHMARPLSFSVSATRLTLLWPLLCIILIVKRIFNTIYNWRRHMAKIYSDITELIGGTPLIRLSRFAPGASILAKLERQNPAGSTKDRVALSMLRTAEAEGRLKKGGVVIEPTSGNTGIGLAALAAALGYKAVIVMPDSMSPERIKLIAAYGAEVVLTPGAEGMAGAVARAEEIAAANPGSIIAGQFSNPANPRAHYESTGPEIWRDTDGDVAAFVAGVGTGGTISGVGRYLKEQNPAIRIVAMEPASSPLLTEGHAGPHAIQGIGANFIPEALDTSVYDEVVTVTDEDALTAMRELAVSEGLLCGVSSGAAAFAAREIAKRPEFAGKTSSASCPTPASAI